MNRLAYALAASAALLLLAAPPGSGEELPLVNASFEASGPEGLPAAWDRGFCHGPVVISRDETTAHSGRASLRITHRGRGGGDARQIVGQAGLYAGDARRLSAGDRLRLSAWYRTSGLKSCHPKALAHVAVIVDGVCVAKVEADPSALEWRRAEAVAQIPPRTAHSGVGHIEARLWDQTGSIWWDDIRLLRLPAQADDLKCSSVHPPQGADTAPVALSDDQISLSFDHNAGTLLGIGSPATGSAFLAPEAAPAIPVRLTYVGDTPQRLVPELTACTGGSENGRPRLRLDYAMAEGRIKLVLVVRLTGGGRSEWTVYVRNDSETTILGVAWPVLNGLRVGAAGADDCLAYPWRGGQLLPDPSSARRILPPDYVGTASMGWLDLYDEPLQEAVYLGSHDPQFLDMRMNLTPRAAGGAIGVDIEKRPYVAPGSEWRSAPVVLAVHRGDWHHGSKIYREWAETVIKPASPPAWLREAFCWDTGEFLPKYWRFEHIPALWDRAAERGFSAVSYQGQMVLNHCSRYYYPDPFLGTPEELAQGNREVERRGGRMLYYTNAIGWQRRYPEHLPPKYDGLIPAGLKPTWEEMAALVRRHRDGSEVIQYKDKEGDNDNFVMCPGAQGWQEHMRFWVVDKYLSEYGSAGMMVDQAGALAWRPCYNFSHGHRHHGSWGAGLGELLRTIYEGAHAVRPDACIYIEGRSDYLSQWSDTCMFAIHGNLPEMLRYTFPEILVGYDRSDPDDSFLLGGLLQWGARYPNPRLDAVGKVQRAVADIRGYARFVDTDGLGELPEGVRARALVHDAKGVVLVNLSDQRQAPAPFSLTVSREIYAGRAVIGYYYPEQLGGQRISVPASMAGGLVRVDIPGMDNGGAPKVAALVLTPKELPVLEIEGPAEVDWDEPFSLRVTSGGRPVAAAQVHIGNRTYTTDRSGTVRETFTRDDPDGVWLLTAKKEGYLSARRTLRLLGPWVEVAKALP
ncbi:MAG: DUF6259 domain-containing protein [Armatimonadota bacterium]